MPDTRDLRPVAEAAEQAAARGDYVTAERLLRELAQLEESNLGPLHADLANTLNNLGVVCDISDKPDDAEQFYRRALAIARATRDPDHPFVVTSEKNLRDFCAARGRPVQSQSEALQSPEGPVHARPTPAAETSAAAPARRSAAVLLAGVTAAIVLVGVLAIRPWSRSNRPEAPAQAAAQPSSTPQPASGSSAAEPSAGRPATGSPATTVERPSTPANVDLVEREARGAVDARARREASGPPAPTVAAARVCKNLATGESRSLDDWPCEPPGAPARPGSLFFYTRVRSARDTTVEHRWYRGRDLLKTIELEVLASPTDGYRTYSRNVVDGRDGGDWRVELRSKDGALLHEESFSVR